jgi:hypothetical protein
MTDQDRFAQIIQSAKVLMREARQRLLEAEAEALKTLKSQGCRRN